MSGKIGITCTLQDSVKKELYFKALDVLETTHNSIKLSYLTNLDKPVNSINTRNIEKMEPRVPEIGPGIDVGGLNFSNTLDFTPDVSLSGDTIIVNSINNLHISTSVKGTTSNKIILTSNCNGYFSFAGTINTGNNTSITIKSGAKVFFYNAGKINEGCRSGTVSLTIEDGAIVNFENSGTIGGVIKTSESSVVITKTEEDFDKLKYKEPSTSASVETVNGLHILSEQFTSIDSLKIFDINNKTGEITIKEPLTIEHGTGPDDCGKMIINNGCKVISNNLYFEDAGRSTGQKWGDPGSWGSLFINNGEIIVSNKTTLYINCSVSPISEYLLHENNGIIYNLGEIDGKEHLKGTGRIVELEFTAEVNGELYNNITVDKVNRTVTINNLTPETDYDINLIVSFEPYIAISNTVKVRTVEVPFVTYGVRIMTNNSNPETAITYIEEAVGTTPAKNGNLNGWKDKWPFNKIRIVGFKNGQVTKEINPMNKTKYIDGSNVPADVDVMAEYPKVYWKVNTISNGYEIRISNKKIDSEYKCLAHLVGGIEKDNIYIGTYLGYIENGKLRSKSGVSPTANTTLTQFRKYAQAVGYGYQLDNWYPLVLRKILYLIAYKNLNSQSALGRGYTDSNNNAIRTGGTNTKGLCYGSSNGSEQICFLGIEDFYGNLRTWVDGMYYNGNIMVTPDNKTFNDSASGFKNVGSTTNWGSFGYISDVVKTTEGLFFPYGKNGSLSTYYSDYANVDSDYFSVHGGDYDDSDYAGAFVLHVYWSASESDSNIGSRLVYMG